VQSVQSMPPYPTPPPNSVAPYPLEHVSFRATTPGCSRHSAHSRCRQCCMDAFSRLLGTRRGHPGLVHCSFLPTPSLGAFSMECCPGYGSASPAPPAARPFASSLLPQMMGPSLVPTPCVPVLGYLSPIQLSFSPLHWTGAFYHEQWAIFPHERWNKVVQMGLLLTVARLNKVVHMN
jgi:hypothetical protein